MNRLRCQDCSAGVCVCVCVCVCVVGVIEQWRHKNILYGANFKIEIKCSRLHGNSFLLP